MTQWCYVAASAIGTSHEKQSLPCQDYAKCEIIYDSDKMPVLVAVVSDGAGSAELSQIGSELACTLLIQEAANFLAAHSVPSIDRAVVSAWLESVRVHITKTAEEAEKRPRDYACTVLAALISEKHSAFIQIGDGAIVISEGGESNWGWVFWPQRGEFANTTFFLTDDTALEKMEFDSLPVAVREVALFTDGIEPLVLDYAAKAVHNPFFDNMFPAVRSSQAIGFDAPLSESLVKYLASPKVCERTDDDKSLILASRKDSPASAAI